MKSLLQTLVRATVVAGLGLVASFSAVADDQPGMVRIAKPSTADVQSGRVTPAGFNNWGGSNCDCQSGMGMGMGAGKCWGGYGGHCWGGHGWGGHCWGGNGCYGDCNSCPFGANHFFGLRHCNGCGYGCGNGCCNSCCGKDMCNYFRCKFGYFIPTGAGGAGVPYVGKYSRVYPNDPYYFDQRDGMAWAAQGYGIPMAVPLAPVVGHTYNYSWGTPSSRLTPVSRPAY